NESNYSKALNYYERAKQVADSIKDISSIVKIEEGIGSLFYNINRPLRSIEIFKETETKINPDEMPFELINIYSKLGTVLTSIDSLKQAENYFLKGIELAERTGDIYNSLVLKTELAHNFYKQNNFAKATSHLSEAQKTANEYQLTQLLALQDLYLGKIYTAENSYSKANERFQNSFRLSKDVKDINTQIESGYLLAKNFEEELQFDKAESWYSSTMNLIENISFPLILNQEIQIAHFSGLNDIYNSFAKFYLIQGKNKEAFTIIDKSRSRNTKVNLDKLQLVSQLREKKDYDKIIDLQWMIESGLYSQSETDSIKQKLEELEIDLTKKNKDIAGMIGRNHAIDLNELQKHLSEDENLISVYVADDFTTLFKLNQKDFGSISIDLTRDSLLSMLRSISPIYKDGLENDEIYINEDLFSFNSYAAYKFYEIIFSELLSTISKESKLIVSLPPDLVKLPLELLVTEWNEDDSPYYYRNKNFLLEDFQIMYTPSAAIYNIQKGRNEQSSKQNLLVGDPFINDGEF
ncbi:MAG: hypothetical protein R3250_17565, partial [Melioribacteraceae bacterium]|nr:hypothetical protein [Melioribacteraceae bacterium]